MVLRPYTKSLVLTKSVWLQPVQSMEDHTKGEL